MYTIKYNTPKNQMLLIERLYKDGNIPKEIFESLRVRLRA